ncbi:MAG TPA: pyruvate, phosphate dikinase [Kofleriaceae bacterium]|nr:pyruvate, phosphate dikinase [Kofleriaceae bacterium]
MPRHVYRFGGGEADGRGDQVKLLGGKGAGLAEMTALGVPVPPGFTITTEVCTYYYENDRQLPDTLRGQVDKALEAVAESAGRRFGDPADPLLLSVRSGAPASMPGMMDTILDLGLNDETVEGLARATGDARFAYDCYRRFVAMYGEIVMGVRPEEEEGESPFDRLLSAALEKAAVRDERDLDAAALRSLVTELKIEILRRTDRPFPEDPSAQLWGAIEAVLRSWENPRAEFYRRMHGLDRNMGTAVNVQAMVFGNRGDRSGSGVCFTRNPATGEPGLYGEMLWRAQGEDVVAGTRTPEPIEALGTRMPEVYQQLTEVCARLERHFADMQDIEFTIEEGHLWLLQTRRGKRTGKAMVRVAVDLVREGVIDARGAIERIDPDKLSEVMHSTISPEGRPAVLVKGLPASPGAAIGRVVFSAGQAEEWAARGDSVILVRTETSPEDIHGMKVAAGILTARGGMTSHAAVVARGMGRPCVTAATAMRVDHARERFTVAGTTVGKGDVISIDGSTGEVFVGPASLVPAALSEEFHVLMGWVDEVRRLRVRTNADTPADARTARAFGAEGIGLCRTEHMFFAPERILAVREMILAGDEAGRRAALDRILPMQRGDFLEIFRAMDGLPVTIRLLDPPLHEFLPSSPAEIAEVARDLKRKPEEVQAAVAALREQNPMLGHRGCRLAMSYPEIYETQTQAIAEAAVAAAGEGISVHPEIMIPFVSMPGELSFLRERVGAVWQEVTAASGVELPVLIGTMIELPRACLIGDRIAEHADFFSFGTNDLTQMVYGLSRDDSGRFLPSYLEQGTLERDPFAVLDRAGVGALIRIGVEKGRARKTKLKIGICGEHGGDPQSVEFCHVEGFDYVSCSPFRVPIARVAAARAALRGEARSR